ncbi:Uu.00g048520.m01.CDS01 [Anthostomella pinea]|uniref:Uu.00g048520.m01.CDS01 n=1 Tax=Anthostomella pinea TaxID=933095 RepID=A0AAI8VBM6_9PEZI|nr:Uu.00g048520.m01.CDS01 [Anthostomella pinea]
MGWNAHQLDSAAIEVQSDTRLYHPIAPRVQTVLITPNAVCDEPSDDFKDLDCNMPSLPVIEPTNKVSQAKPKEPGDAHPTALQISKDEGRDGSPLSQQQVIIIPGCSPTLCMETASPGDHLRDTLPESAQSGQGKATLGGISNGDNVHLRSSTSIAPEASAPALSSSGSRDMS